jgi:MFS family permease
MSDAKAIPVDTAPSARRSFAAMRHPGFRAQFVTFVLAMMADNIEHVISYWMLYQKFHSPALAGFAIVSHWLPFLLFSVASGALADRFDPRRIIQIGMALFITASLSWSYFFVTGTLQMWQAMVILVIHGCAGVLWQTPNQMLLYDIVGPSDLESAVRLNAMARYLAVLAGPAVGAAILLAFGPAPGIMLNTVFYLPLVLWLVNAPYGPRFRSGTAASVGFAISCRPCATSGSIP